MSPAKSAHGDGGYRKRRGGYEIRLWIDSQRVSRWARTEREAKRILSELRQTRASGGSVENERITVAQYLDDWLAGIKERCAPRTYDRYEQQVRLYLKPALGKRRLSELRPGQIQQCYATWGDRLSSTTVRHIHACLRAALSQAVRWEMVERNVAKLVRPPSAQQYEAATLTRAQMSHLLATARGDRFEALYVLALTTGMREGELLGLKWDAIDMDAQRLTVRTQLIVPTGGPQLGRPKTARGVRTVPLLSVAIDALTRHRARQAADQLAAGSAWQDRGLVFSTTLGGFLMPGDLLYKQFHPLLERAGLPPMRFHELRHTVATLLHEGGTAPRVVADLLGHAQVSVTLDVYTHGTATMMDQARAELEAHFGGNGGYMGATDGDGAESSEPFRNTQA